MVLPYTVHNIERAKERSFQRDRGMLTLLDVVWYYSHLLATFDESFENETAASRFFFGGVVPNQKSPSIRLVTFSLSVLQRIDASSHD